MRIGIDASRAFLKNRTGVEEYSYQVIKHLMDKLDSHQVVLYMRGGQSAAAADCPLPQNWKIKVIKFPYFWTQLGLSLEMLLRPVDMLFVPAHTVPIVHPASTRGDRSSTRGGPKNTIVTIHGLEYEVFPRGYSFWARLYMRWSIKMSCRWVKKIIAVSENTKKDLMKLYGVEEGKMEVIYEGYNRNFEFLISNFESSPNDQISNSKNSKFKIQNSKFVLFIGRLEERKNIIGIIKAFEILKEHYKIPHKLILAGGFGYGAEKIQEELKNTNCGSDIILPGYVSEEEKWELLKNADVFLFPTHYEGFGIPVLEAQSVGCPVVAGNNSSIREIITLPLSPWERRDVPEGQRGWEANAPHDLPLAPSLPWRGGMESALLADPNNAEQIADAAYKLISDKALRDDIIKKGYENVKRFSWEKCASEIAEILTK